MSAGARQLAASAAAALARHAPFDRMEPAVLARLSAKLSIAYYARGATVTGPALGHPGRLFIVKSGRVRGPDETLHEGECFPAAALLAARLPAGPYEAETDVFCWELPEEDFRRALEDSRHFRAFCTDRLALLLDEAQRAMRAEAAADLADETAMLAPLSSVLRRPPVSCPPEASIREAVRTMHEQRIGSIVVADAAGAPAGIFTTVDLLTRVASPGLPMERPIREAMTPHPLALEASAPLIEAAHAMARHGFRHVVVTRDGALAGVVSERDLFSLQRTSVGRLAERIRTAPDADALAAAAAAVRGTAGQLLLQGVPAEQTTRIVAALNDSLTQRVISLAAGRHVLAGRWCWLALGSEGRMEQTLVTDQDNALIVDAPQEAKPAYLAFADEVNRGLEACGFPLCKGDIMARNPRWCLAPDEWRARFDAWIRNTEPEALLSAAIFFDFRPLAGHARLAADLRREVLMQARSRPAFCHAMAQAALTVRPALGWIADFSGTTLDLKLHGARVFVDAARVLALAAGEVETGTAARLRAANEPVSRLDAFHFIQTLRLRAGANEVAAARFSAIERRVLKEALHEAARLQERLRADFP
jgi:CBS domain-containing protein